MNWKLELSIINLFFVFIGTMMFYAVFTTGGATIILKEDPKIYYLVLSVSIVSLILSLIGINLNRIRLAKEVKE